MPDWESIDRPSYHKLEYRVQYGEPTTASCAVSSKRRASRFITCPTTGRDSILIFDDKAEQERRARRPAHPVRRHAEPGREQGVRAARPPRPRGAARRVHAPRLRFPPQARLPALRQGARDDARVCDPRAEVRAVRLRAGVVRHRRRQGRRDAGRGRQGVARRQARRQERHRQGGERAHQHPDEHEDRPVRHQLRRPHPGGGLPDDEPPAGGSQPGQQALHHRVRDRRDADRRVADARDGALRRRAVSARHPKTPKPIISGPPERDRRRPRRRGDPHRRVRPRARPVPLGPRGAVGREQLVLDARQPGLGRPRLRHDQPPAHRAGGDRRLPRAAIPIGRSSSAASTPTLQKTPYKLPDNKTQSGWKSNSSPAATATTRSCSRTRRARSSSACRPRRTCTSSSRTTSRSRSATTARSPSDNDRTASIGNVDSTTVGMKHTIQIAQGQDPPPSTPPTGIRDDRQEGHLHDGRGDA